MEERTTQTTGLESYCGIFGGGDLIHQRLSFISVLPKRIFFLGRQSHLRWHTLHIPKGKKTEQLLDSPFNDRSR